MDPGFTLQIQNMLALYLFIRLPLWLRYQRKEVTATTKKKSHCVRREPESNIKLASGAAVFSPFVFYQLKCVSQKENTVVTSFVVVSLVAFRASTLKKKMTSFPRKGQKVFSTIMCRLVEFFLASSILARRS